MRALPLMMLVLASGCFDATVVSGTSIRCATNDDCPGGLACRVGQQVCVAATLATPSCGDGIVDDGEACDDGDNNQDAPDTCRTTCTAPTCGDGIIDSGEVCDDGASNDDRRGNACRQSCVPPRCGDGVIDSDFGESCDDGDDNSDTAIVACRSTCVVTKIPVCGDTIVDDGEGCDDGNDNPVDGCDACHRQRFAATVLVRGSVGELPPLQTVLAAPSGVAVDALGRLYVADTFNHRVRRLDPDGTFVTVAGSGTETITGGGLAGFSGDGGPGQNATLNRPTAVAADRAGRIFIADAFNHRIRRIDVDGTITTVAGTGTPGFSGDGAAAENARLNVPAGVAVDGQGRIFIADANNNRIRRIDTNGIITTIAGTGAAGFSGDGIAATTAALRFPTGVATDGVGTVFIADGDNHRVRAVGRDGLIQTVMGNGTPGASPDGTDARAASLLFPSGVAFDAARGLMVADTENHRIVTVDFEGRLRVVAGTGAAAFSGDDGPATEAALASPFGVAVDAGGGVIIADTINARVRHIDAAGRITTIVGGTTDPFGFAGNGGAATSAPLLPSGIVVDAVGRVYVSDGQNSRVRRIEVDATIDSVAGVGGAGFSGDGGLPTAAALNLPFGLAIDSQARLLVGDSFNHRIRRITFDDVGVGTLITTMAGTGVAGYSGDGGPATEAELNRPLGIVARGDAVLVVDPSTHTVRQIDADGVITTIAGDGTSGRTGDGGPAVLAQLGDVAALALDREGRLLIADAQGHNVRRIDTDGVITRFAGTAVRGFSGDGGPATDAELNEPIGLAVGDDDRVYIADQRNARVRVVDTDGTITTFAGTGTRGTDGDGGQATDATMNTPVALAFDHAGGLLIADFENFRVRRVDTDGVITSVAGQVHPLGPGPLAQAGLYAPRHAVVVGDDVVFAGDFGRLLRMTASAVDVVVGYGDAGISDRARFAPLLQGAAGLAFDEDARRLFVAEHDSATLRVIDLDTDDDGAIDDAGLWRIADVALPADAALAAPAGLWWQADVGRLLVADEGDHCVKRVDVDGQSPTVVVAGQCGIRGSFAGFLDAPTQVTASVRGTVFVSDTGNNKVIQINDAGDAIVIIGDGSRSSAGEGGPARLFPVDTPGQLALDGVGNLYVTSRTTVRLITNADDDDTDNDAVFTIFGGGERATFPESDASCLTALVVEPTGSVVVADACSGFAARVASAVDP